MHAPTRADLASSVLSRLQDVPRWLLAPVPLALMQPILGHIATHVAKSRPELFARLGPHSGKRFLIDPINLPFVFILVPDPANPHLKAHRRYDTPRHDAGIAGTFLDLLDMIAGSLDGDALFFARDLRITGDIEAVVALRNALDDVDGGAVDTILGAFGPLSGPAALALSALRAIGKDSRDAR